jgi:hypothetical protein
MTDQKNENGNLSGYDAQNVYGQGGTADAAQNAYGAQDAYGQGGAAGATQNAYGAQNAYGQGGYSAMPPQDYYSGGNPYLTVPPEIKKWNWGAFMFNWIWGIGNHAYMALLCLVPCFGVIWMFICGAKGNEWAWKSGEFRNVEIFLAVQKTWNRGGLVQFILLCFWMLSTIAILIFYGALIFAILGSEIGSNLSGTYDYF